MARSSRQRVGSALVLSAPNRTAVLHAFLRGADEAIIVFDTTGSCVALTEEACRLLEINPAAASRTNMMDFFPNGWLVEATRDSEKTGDAEIKNAIGEKITIFYKVRKDAASDLASVSLSRDGRWSSSQRFKKLSGRECEVITMLAKGGSNQSIAEELGLSPETVRHYTRTARLTLGAKTRSQAIALAVLYGYIGTDDMSA